jgi:hypothetical protein
LQFLFKVAHKDLCRQTKGNNAVHASSTINDDTLYKKESPTLKANSTLVYTNECTCVCMCKKQADRNNFVTTILKLKVCVDKTKTLSSFFLRRTR